MTSTGCETRKNNYKTMNLYRFQAFVHVSTAFSFCAERKLIEEKLYDPPIPASNLITVMDQLDDAVIDRLTPQ